MIRRFSTPPDAAEMEAMAERALASIPRRLRAQIGNVGIAIEDLADDETIAEMGLESPWELTGLYHGVPLPQRSVDDIARLPDQVTLYRLAILFEWVELGEDLERLVRSVLIHELAHHVGFSDAEIEALEREI